MVHLCRKCYKDVTEAYAAAEVKRKFRCSCGCGIFIQQNDDPLKPYELSHNDRKFLRALRIEPGEPEASA